jgi:acetyl-CoA C-acetyltransferase
MTRSQDMYLSRVACINGGLPVETALTLNRLTGLQAIVSASRTSCWRRRRGRRRRRKRAPPPNSQRWGSRMGDSRTST